MVHKDAKEHAVFMHAMEGNQWYFQNSYCLISKLSSISILHVTYCTVSDKYVN